MGQLGIVTRLTFEIVPQPVIKRTRTSLTAYESVDKLSNLANAWKKGKAQGKSLQEVMAETGYLDFIVSQKAIKRLSRLHSVEAFCHRKAYRIKL